VLSDDQHTFHLGLIEGTAKMDIYSDACQHYNDSLSLLELFTLEQLYPNIPTTEDFVS
jgi:hypothetical protein